MVRVEIRIQIQIYGEGIRSRSLGEKSSACLIFLPLAEVLLNRMEYAAPTSTEGFVSPLLGKVGIYHAGTVTGAEPEPDNKADDTIPLRIFFFS